jgi:hypothetical protein
MNELEVRRVACNCCAGRCAPAGPCESPGCGLARPTPRRWSARSSRWLGSSSRRLRRKPTRSRSRRRRCAEQRAAAGAPRIPDLHAPVAGPARRRSVTGLRLQGGMAAPAGSPDSQHVDRGTDRPGPPHQSLVCCKPAHCGRPGAPQTQEFNLEKLQLLEQEKSKIRKDYERRESQVDVKKKMCAGCGRTVLPPSAAMRLWPHSPRAGRGQWSKLHLLYARPPHAKPLHAGCRMLSRDPHTCMHCFPPHPPWPAPPDMPPTPTALKPQRVLKDAQRRAPEGSGGARGGDPGGGQAGVCWTPHGMRPQTAAPTSAVGSLPGDSLSHPGSRGRRAARRRQQHTQSGGPASMPMRTCSKACWDSTLTPWPPAPLLWRVCLRPWCTRRARGCARWPRTQQRTAS